MANGSISNEVHKSVATGIYVTVTVDDYSNIADSIHAIMAILRTQLNSLETTLFYATVNNFVPYYGFVNKSSAKIMSGQMFVPTISDTRRILFRDSSDDSTATYNIVT